MNIVLICEKSTQQKKTTIDDIQFFFQNDWLKIHCFC